jgi:hypothetical protein
MVQGASCEAEERAEGWSDVSFKEMSRSREVFEDLFKTERLLRADPLLSPIDCGENN